MQISIIGCGNMGLIYARAFLKYELCAKEELLLIEKLPERKKSIEALNLGIVGAINELKIDEAEVILLAIKPQDFSQIIPFIQPVLTEKTLLVSIMAGISNLRLAEVFNHVNIVRAMPNAPVEYGLGITGFSAHPQISSELLRKAETILSTTGRIVYFDNEEKLNAVTAISGSGPAYFYYFVQAMIEAGIAMGLSKQVATQLVQQTMLGSFHLLNSSGKSTDELIKTVASKGGTTKAALSHMNSTEVNKNIIEALLKAEKRAKELSKI